jgi:sulfur-oxidizing protein SoxY
VSNIKRRVLLKGAVASGVVVAAAGAGLLTPRSVLAAWPQNAFEAKSAGEALSTLVGGDNPAKSSDITIKAPDIAENGAVVPVTVEANMPNVESITVLVAENEQPLAASFNLGSDTMGYVATRVKMRKTSDVTAVVKAGGKLLSFNKEVKVTIGGCGG